MYKQVVVVGRKKKSEVNKTDHHKPWPSSEGTDPGLTFGIKPASCSSHITPWQYTPSIHKIGCFIVLSVARLYGVELHDELEWIWKKVAMAKL
jgi:hypothetical protein